MASWDFIPNHIVVENLPPEQPSGLSMNGWYFSSKPTVPWQNKFKVTMHGLQWFLNTDGTYDDTSNGSINARRFENFIEEHGKWKTFDFPHPHLGTIECVFSALPAVPKGDWNANGVIPAFEVELVARNPAFKNSVGSGPPSNVALPIISGVAQQGQTLTVSPGTWTNAPTGFTYQWKRGGVDISGATGTTYVLTAADVGSTITCTVTATNSQGSSAATSLATSTVLPAAPVNQSLPVISGTTQQDQTLSVTNGTWANSPTSYAYQWKRGGVNIAGAINNTYLLVQADVGSSITCTVTATNAGGSTAATSSGTSAILPLAPVNTGAPTISGTTVQGSTLSVTSNGTWSNNPTSYTYQWKRDGAAISGETAATYVLAAADVGTNITCTVTAINAGGSGQATSNALGPITASGTLVAPSVTRTTAVDQIPEYDIVVQAEYQGFLLRIQRNNVGAGQYGSPTMDIVHEITPSDIGNGSVVMADLVLDGYTDPAGAWWMRCRIERQDGAVSAWSNETSGNVQFSACQLHTATGFNKKSFVSVTGTPPLTWTGNSGVNANQPVRSTHEASSALTQWEFTLNALDGTLFYVGYCDTTDDFGVGFKAPGNNTSNGIAIAFSGAGAATNGSISIQWNSGANSVTIAGPTTGLIQVGDTFSIRLNKNTNQIAVYRIRGGVETAMGSAVTVPTLPSYFTYGAPRKAESGTMNYGATTFAKALDGGYTFHA